MGQAHTGDIVVDIYYRLPDQEEEIDEAFYRETKAASRSRALIITRDSNTMILLERQHSEAQTGGSCSALIITF